jgi:hypothetical protein
MEDRATWTFSCLRMVDRCEKFNFTHPEESQEMLYSESCILVSFFIAYEWRILDYDLEDASTLAREYREQSKYIYNGYHTRHFFYTMYASSRQSQAKQRVMEALSTKEGVSGRFSIRKGHFQSKQTQHGTTQCFIVGR